MGASDNRDDASLLADAMRRAAVLRAALTRDREGLACWPGWPEGPALYADAIAAVERVMAELDAESPPAAKSPAEGSPP